jgi:FtsP/CotA-like multicopper oxidase with cupredoxin domain
MKKIFLFVYFASIQYLILAQYNPLPIPPVLTGPIYNLNIQHGTHDFDPLDTFPISPTLGYNGNVLGPTLIMQAGQKVQMNVHNGIGETTTVHWHNLHVSSENDGGPHSEIEPNTTWSPSFTIDDKAATFWYHPHIHFEASNQIWKGLAGMIIVKDAEEAALNLPRTYGVDDFPLILQGRKIKANGDVAVTKDMFSISPNENLRTVNGVDKGNLNVPRQMVRFRVLNGSVMTAFNLGLSNNANFYQIGTDGGLLQSRYQTNRLLLSPGERAELVVDFSSYPVGTEIKLKSYAAELPSGIPGARFAHFSENPSGSSPLTWPAIQVQVHFYDGNFDLVNFTVAPPTSSPVLSIPTSLVTVNRLAESSATQSRQKYFAFTGSGAVICNTPAQRGPDCFAFNPARIDETVSVDAIETWTIHGGPHTSHPFHLHGGQFYILEKRDSANNIIPLQPNELGRKDVVLVRRLQSVKIIRHFDDFGNEVPYMFHCHLTVHEDKGMMHQLIVKKEIFVNKNHTGPENGSQTNPYNTAAEAVTAASDGATIIFLSNMDHDELGSILATTKRITFKPSTGSVTIK